MAPRSKKASAKTMKAKKAKKAKPAVKVMREKKQPAGRSVAASPAAMRRSGALRSRALTLLEMPQTGALLGGIAGVLFFVGFLLVVQSLIPGEQTAEEPEVSPFARNAVIDRVPSVPSEEAPTAAPVGAPYIQSLLPATIVAGGQTGGFAEAKQTVIRTGQDWSTLWTQLPGAPRPTVRSIDFNRYSVAAVFAGTQATAGVSVEISHAVQADGKTTVYAAVVSPGPKCNAAREPISPFRMALLPRVDGPVEFVVEKRTREC